MRLATFIPPGGGDPRSGEVRDGRVVAFDAGTVLDRLASGDRTPAAGEEFELGAVTLLAPVGRPRAIFGVGLNYGSHAAETGRDLPEFPIVFMKLPTSSVPPGGPVRCPKVVRRLDYEGELAVVIGAGGEIAGYAVADDVSARDLQGREPQWLRLRTWVNGELRQDASTSDLVFGPQQVVDFLRDTCTLEPGDLILTGTPSGVGVGQDPMVFLQSGDVIRIEIESLGEIEHAVA